MKQIIFAIVCFLLASVSTAFAQDFKNVQEPEYIGIYYNVNLGDGTLTQLEKQNWSTRSKGKVKLFGFGGVESEGEVVLDGSKSAVRFPLNQRLTFAVRVESNLVDPSTIIGFSLVEIKEGKRVLASTRIKTSLIGAKQTDTQGKAVLVKVQKYGKSSYIFFPTQPLSPGEYVLTIPQSPYVYCFGIDSIPSKPSTDLIPFIGRYNSQDRKADYFDLKADGTMFLQQQGKPYSGRYDVNNSQIIFVINGVTSRGEIRDDIVLDPDKGKWIRQKP